MKGFEGLAYVSALMAAAALVKPHEAAPRFSFGRSSFWAERWLPYWPYWPGSTAQAVHLLVIL